MRPIDITFTIKELTKEILYSGKPLRYHGVRVGTITGWSVNTVNTSGCLCITARISSEEIFKKIISGKIIPSDFSIKGKKE